MDWIQSNQSVGQKNSGNTAPKNGQKKRGHWPRLMMTCYRRLTGDSVIPLLAKTTQREICTPSEDH